MDSEVPRFSTASAWFTELGRVAGRDLMIKHDPLMVQLKQNWVNIMAGDLNITTFQRMFLLTIAQINVAFTVPLAAPDLILEEYDVSVLKERRDLTGRESLSDGLRKTIQRLRFLDSKLTPEELIKIENHWVKPSRG